MGAQRVGSHTVQLPTDNIKRRPSHIYIAPKVPAQPHARPTSGLSYEIRKRAQQTWIGPTGAVALHTTGATRNRGALTYGFHKATTLKARVVTPKDGPSSSQRLRIRNKIVRKWLHNSGRLIDRIDTDFVDAASLKECDRFFDTLCDSGRTMVSFEALRDWLAHCCGLDVDDEKLEHVVKTIIRRGDDGSRQQSDWRGPHDGQRSLDIWDPEPALDRDMFRMLYFCGDEDFFEAAGDPNLTVALWAQAHYRRRTIDATLEERPPPPPLELPATMAIEDRIQAELEHELAAIEKGKPVPALANWPSVVEDAPESRPPSRGCGAGDACVSRPTTPTQNRLKLKRSTTEDAVADERLWPLSGEEEGEDAEAGMGGGRPTGGGGRALDWWRRPGLSKGSWPARTRRLVERARDAATRRLQAGVLVERVDTKRRQALATQRGAVPAWKPPRGRGPRAPRTSGDGFTETYAKDPFLKEPPHGHFYASQRARAAARPGTAGVLLAAAWATTGPRPLREGKARFRSERRPAPPNIDRSGVWDKQNDPRNCSMSFTFRDGPGG